MSIKKTIWGLALVVRGRGNALFKELLARRTRIALKTTLYQERRRSKRRNAGTREKMVEKKNKNRVAKVKEDRFRWMGQ